MNIVVLPLAVNSGEITRSDIPNGQWTTQLFTDQIPSFSDHGGTQEPDKGN